MFNLPDTLLREQPQSPPLRLSYSSLSLQIARPNAMIQGKSFSFSTSGCGIEWLQLGQYATCVEYRVSESADHSEYLAIEGRCNGSLFIREGVPITTIPSEVKGEVNASSLLQGPRRSDVSSRRGEKAMRPKIFEAGRSPNGERSG